MVEKDLPGTFNGDRFLTLPGMMVSAGVRPEYDQWSYSGGKDLTTEMRGTRAAVPATQCRGDAQS